MDPLTASIVFSAGAGGAGAGAGGTAAVMSNPFTAAAAIAALATAYGTSPTVRKKTNVFAKKGYEAITNPFQHFGDGTEKDKFGSALRGLNGLMQGRNGQLDMGGGVAPGEWSWLNPNKGGLGSMLNNPLTKQLGRQVQQKSPQQKQQEQRRAARMIGGPGGWGSNMIPTFSEPLSLGRPPAPFYQSNPNDQFGLGSLGYRSGGYYG